MPRNADQYFSPLRWAASGGEKSNGEAMTPGVKCCQVDGDVNFEDPCLRPYGTSASLSKT